MIDAASPQRGRSVSLRARLAIAAGVAVALAVIAVAVSAYAGTRSELQGQVDKSLNSLAQPILMRAGVTHGPGSGGGGSPVGSGGGGSYGPGAGGAGYGPGARGSGSPGGLGQAGAVGPGPVAGATGGSSPGATATDCDGGLGLDFSRGGGFGSAPGYVQVVAPDGSTCLATGESTGIPVDARVKALAASGSGHYLTDTHVGSTHLRVLAYGIGSLGALQVALPLTQVDDALSSQLLLLIAIAAGGIALAALLGVLVARTALAPIARFTRQTETIAANPERIDQERLEVQGSDELARLAQTFNRTLDALERSVQAQRNLVADASHELRTPIATIRANLQLMRDEALLSAEDRAALRADVIEELDELTALVSDVVELARGSKPSGEPGDVRLDEIVAAAVQRTRRRSPQLSVQAKLEPTLVYGEGDRIARAVANLLDNAAKWSPPGGAIELELRDGSLTVRDHGPGFHEEDVPFVFDRFHRARDARAKAGSGLGLAIVRQAAEAHGGSVEAANAPDGGALMRISFGPPVSLDELGQPAALGATPAAHVSSFSPED
jgi:two-component system, OmpR family, sensor histidine kinase MprB